MRVETVNTIAYIFTQDEVDMLSRVGIWELLLERLNDNERVEIE
jgi:hypothetical protein